MICCGTLRFRLPESEPCRSCSLCVVAAVLGLAAVRVDWEGVERGVGGGAGGDAVADGGVGGGAGGRGVVVDFASWGGAPGVCALPASGTVDRTCIGRSGFVVDGTADDS